MSNKLKKSTAESSNEALNFANGARKLARAVGNGHGIPNELSVYRNATDNVEEDIYLNEHYGTIYVQDDVVLDDKNGSKSFTKYKSWTDINSEKNAEGSETVEDRSQFPPTVEVDRLVLDRPGDKQPTKGTVNMLTGERAKRATEILHRRAARNIGRTSMEAINNIKFE